MPRAVRLSTIHSAKGLDAACVLLFATHELDGREDEEAREELYVSYHGPSRLMEELEGILTAGR